MGNGHERKKVRCTDIERFPFDSSFFSCHKSNKAIGIYSIQKPNFSSELLISIPYFAQPSNRYVKRERSGESHELIHFSIFGYCLTRRNEKGAKIRKQCAHLLSRPFVSFFFYPASSSVRSLGFSLENKTMEGSSSSKQTEEWTVEDVFKLIKEQYNEEVAKKFEG